MNKRAITVCWAAVFAALILLSAPALGQDTGIQIEEQGGTEYVPGEVVVTEDDGSYVVREVDAETLGAIKEEAEEIEEEKEVLVAGPNYAYEPSFVPNDPFFEQQYNLFRIKVRRAWEYSRGDEVTIGFVDTGYYAAHPDLDAKVKGEYDFVEEDEVAQDFDYHGTGVVGVAAAETDNTEGIAAVGFNAGFLIAKGCTQVCLSSDTAPAVDWLVDQGVGIINLSFGAEQEPPGDPVLGASVQRAQEAGALVIAGAGNDAVNTDSFYPAAYPDVLGVAATDQQNAPAPFSNSGQVVDVAAPGVDIISTYNADYPENTTRALYASFSGTSLAAPQIAGVAALVKARRPDLTGQQIAARIQKRATDLGEPGLDDVYGNGLLNARCTLAPRLEQCVSENPSETPNVAP
jgi:subtilisin family serine protease